MAFAVVAEGCPANKLAGVVAFVRGLLSAHAALDLGVLLACVAFALRFAGAAPCEVEFAITHCSLPQ